MRMIRADVLRSAFAAVRPPKPPPTMTTLKKTLGHKSHLTIESHCCSLLAVPKANRLSASNKLILDVLFACEPEGMLRIEKQSKGKSTILKLSGRMQAHGHSELRAEIEKCNPPPSLDLEEVSLLDRDSVRFLIRCESEGIQLVNCPLYVREWITREQGK